MQKLTFRGYLSRYVRQLSGLNTNSIVRLAKEAQTNYRLREPLFLYAYCSDRMNVLLACTSDSEWGEKFQQVSSQFSFPKLLQALESQNKVLNERYHKCYHSYACRRDMPKTYNRKKGLMRNKILQLQTQKKVTSYRVCLDLGLNRSNVTAYIKHGDVDRVSVDLARKILEYLDGLS